MRQYTTHQIIGLIFTASLLFSCEHKSITRNGIEVIRASSNIATYRINSDWVRDSWTISPQIDSDSLMILCHSNSEDFAFYTDNDSVNFKIKPDEIHEFYVQLNDTSYALTIIKGVTQSYSDLKFENNAKDQELEFWYESNENNEYLNLLKRSYPIDSLVENAENDVEMSLRILNWVHKQWKHNGGNTPSKNDALTILTEAENGKDFRCVEYGIVATSCLNSVGLKSRVLALRTKDVETRQYGAGHVLLEVYLNDKKKWALLDGQWNTMPMLNGIPLNAVEFQEAISKNYNELEIKSFSNASKRQYIDWIYPYLYYFEVEFDNREGIGLERKNIEGKTSLMLVPEGAKEPKIFQIVNKIDYDLYTNSITDFYSAPK